MCAAGTDVERVILLIDADGTDVSSAESRNTEAVETVGGFCVGMAVAVVGTGADEGEGWCMLAVEVGIPAVFAAVVRHEDKIGGGCPWNGG